MKLHPESELLCAFWAPLDLLTCSHENSIQGVSCCVPPGLHFNCWHAAMKFHPGCELLCASWAPLELLTCSHEISSRLWVAVCLLGSTWIADLQPWKFHPVGELLCAICPAFELLTCSHEIPSREWVSVSSALHLNCWHAAMKFHPVCELLCVSWASFQSLMCSHHINSSLYLSSSTYSLHSILLTGCIFQIDNVQGLVKAQFNVRPYAILFSFLHSCTPNYIGAFFAFFYWSD